MLDEYCFKSKNLYNFANFIIRQTYIKEGDYINYYKMDKLLKQEGLNLDYRNMPIVESAQQCLLLLDRNWKSFFNSIKDWKLNKNKYTGKPKVPKYLKKNGRYILILTNRGCKLKNGYIKFPKSFNGFTIYTKVSNLQQVRILPKNNYFIIEVVYKVEIPDLKKDNKKYLGIDIGLDNFATIAFNIDQNPIVINGKGLKSINKYYNKQISHYMKVARRMNKTTDYTNKMNKLKFKRNNIVENFIHKASKFIINKALEYDISIIIIGNNKDWKRNSSMSKIVNQSFIGIPHQRFIEMIQYKAENVGIKVILTEESYTSGTSFLDNEPPIKENYNKNRRIHRGLFKSNNGTLINADVNGAYQIMKKVFPNVFASYSSKYFTHEILTDK